MSFGKTAWPIEMNAIECVPGTELCLCRVEDVRWDRRARWQTWYDNTRYFARGRLPKLTTVFKLIAARMLRRF